MKKLLFSIFFVLNILNIANAGTVSRYFNYATTSEVNAINLNGNFDNIVTALNGGLTNTNINTTAGYRLYEVLGVLPAAGTSGRTVFYTVDSSLNFDTGTQWYSAITLLRPPVQGDIVYFNGTNWVVLGYGTKGKSLTTGGASANPSWEGMTTNGDMEYLSTTRTRLPIGSSGTYLTSNGTAPSWGLNPSLSNVIFCWNGTDIGTTNIVGRKGGTSLTPSMGTYTVDYEFYGVYGNTYRTILTSKFVKIAGISTVTIFGRIWVEGTGGTGVFLQVDVGGQNSYVNNNSATPAWATVATIDVSGLTNGTAYDITIQLKGPDATTSAYCSAVILTAS